MPKYGVMRMKEDFCRNCNLLFINKLIIKKFFQEFVKDDEKSCNFAPSNMAVVAQLVRVPDCGSVGRRFESDLPPRSKAATRNCRCFFVWDWFIFFAIALVHFDFLTPPFARRRLAEPSSFSSHDSEKVQLDCFCYLSVRDNDCSGILFVRKDLAESVPGRPKSK